MRLRELIDAETELLGARLIVQLFLDFRPEIVEQPEQRLQAAFLPNDSFRQVTVRQVVSLLKRGDTFLHDRRTKLIGAKLLQGSLDRQQQK